MIELQQLRKTNKSTMYEMFLYNPIDTRNIFLCRNSIFCYSFAFPFTISKIPSVQFFVSYFITTVTSSNNIIEVKSEIVINETENKIKSKEFDYSIIANVLHFQ